MNLKLDFIKTPAGEHVAQLLIEVLEHGVTKVAVPLGNDLLYALYKGINIELQAFDCKLNDIGKDMQAKAEVPVGLKEQAKDVEPALPAVPADPVLPQ